jgi:hypothetical protein
MSFTEKQLEWPGIFEDYATHLTKGIDLEFELGQKEARKLDLGARETAKKLTADRAKTALTDAEASVPEAKGAKSKHRANVRKLKEDLAEAEKDVRSLDASVKKVDARIQLLRSTKQPKVHAQLDGVASRIAASAHLDAAASAKARDYFKSHVNDKVLAMARSASHCRCPAKYLDWACCTPGMTYQSARYQLIHSQNYFYSFVAPSASAQQRVDLEGAWTGFMISLVDYIKANLDNDSLTQARQECIRAAEEVGDTVDGFAFESEESQEADESKEENEEEEEAEEEEEQQEEEHVSESGSESSVTESSGAENQEEEQEEEQQEEEAKEEDEQSASGSESSQTETSQSESEASN